MEPKTVVETKEKHPGPESPRSKTFTNWRILEDGGFVPVMLKCDGYKGSHPADLSCHTNLPVTAQTVVSHMNPDHSGGWFKIKFRLTEGKKSTFWRELEEAGVELQELFCLHCREQIDLMPRRIIQHLNAHNGANRINMEPQTLGLTLSFQKPELEEMESLYI